MDLGFFPQIDLSITKTLNGANSNLVSGGTAAFDFVVQNLGPLAATEVSVRDIFPAGLTFTDIGNESGAFTVTVNGQTVDVLIGSLAVGASATFQLTASITGGQGLDVTNTASVSGAEVDIDLTNNTDSETLDLPTSDLRIVKTGSIDPVIAGNQLTYQIQVTNEGPDPASGVVVTDQLPGDVTFVSGNVGGNSSLVMHSSGLITATIGTLDANESETVTVVVSVAANANGPLSNTANVTATPNNDTDPSNNSATESTQVARSVDVGITKSIIGTPVAGAEVTYQVQVVNNGPSQARGVAVTDALASILSFVPGSFDPGTSGVTLDQNGQNLTFNVGLLDPGVTETFRFDVLIDPSAQGNIANTAVISTTDPDSDTSNNTGLVSVPVQRQVDLSLNKTVDKSVAVPGQDQIVYTFVVSHATGSVSDASGVMVTDLIPTGLVGTVINAPTADTTDFSNGVVTVGFNSIPLGETRTFTVTANVEQAATGTITNSGSVASAGTELNPGDNTDSATVTLDPDFDVVVSKTVNDATPNPTETVTYTVALNNLGPSTAPGVVLSDTIPVGLTFVSGTLQGQAATSNGTSVSFPAISIASGVTVNATLNFTVNANANGIITNTASIPDLSNAGERDVTNNSDSAEINVIAQADLSISKTASLSEGIVGSNLTYTITVNNSGPSTANTIQVVDTLPAGVSFVSGTGPNGEALSAVGGVVTVNAGNLASAGSFQITINAVITSAATGNQVNSATVSAATSDANTGNNTATATTQVDPSSSTFSGRVFHDRNNNGALDTGEPGIADVVLTLTGSNFLGTAVSFTVTTNANGEYQFANLARGTYIVTQTQPVEFRDGSTILGTGASAVALDNVFSQIALGRDADAINFLFAERSLPLSKRRFLASS
jgi:uncharacterized repeat protein (TIGR01451 family)